MEKIGLNELRKMFLDFYESKAHYRGKSASLIPENDKSLLLINSGMAPLKPFFSGLDTPPAKRMVTCQKCIRTGDIDNVGITDRHGTFFEMLGSFSFGDYFKKESVTWGWEFITQYLKMPADLVWATVYLDDQEAYDLWHGMIGIPEERIVRLGKDDNFWEIGTGPCGPCSELYFDRGESYSCGRPDCKPGCECDRYVEFWNHVFTQFNRDEEGNYTPLAHPNIDTGLGLERLACIMQEVRSIFDVDTIRSILNQVVRISGVVYQDGQAKTDVSIRIITDHIRSVTFMVGDGILPSNEGRGYVLRRLLRRAARHGKLLRIQGPFLAELSAKVIEVSGDAYPEIRQRQDYIHRILSVEEEKFSSTIDQGTRILEDYTAEMKEAGETCLSGEKVFKLYDTFGFPMELTREILEEKGFSVDEPGFEDHMKRQKETARASRKVGEDEAWSEESVLYASAGDTQFVGYDVLQCDCLVTGLFQNKKEVESVSAGQRVNVALNQTPFYAEMGGQASDQGILLMDGFTGQVTHVAKVKDVFVHTVEVKSGQLKKGDGVHAEVLAEMRNEHARNHTATHLLHRALKNVLGQHVEQAGSSLNEQGLRFDFTHFESLTKEQLSQIEEIVNQQIQKFLPVTTQVMPIEEARKTGAAAQFGEKYGSVVRVVSAGDFSTEFCGGTHVTNTGQIGAFHILSESGVAAGVRRMEAVTGMSLYRRLTENQQLVTQVAEALKTNQSGLLTRAETVMDELRSSKKELEQLKLQSMGGQLDDMINQALSKNGVKLIRKEFQDCDIAELRSLSDQLKARENSLIILFAAVNDGKVTFMVSVSDDLLEKGYHAGNMIKPIAAAAGGGGGGKADMAQAGGKDPSKISDAFQLAASLL